jgi:hypothetical protein
MDKDIGKKIVYCRKRQDVEYQIGEYFILFSMHHKNNIVSTVISD